MNRYRLPVIGTPLEPFRFVQIQQFKKRYSLDIRKDSLLLQTERLRALFEIVHHQFAHEFETRPTDGCGISADVCVPTVDDSVLRRLIRRFQRLVYVSKFLHK